MELRWPPPNPRVQRTRSSPSARHSPLTRSPLGARNGDGVDMNRLSLALIALVAAVLGGMIGARLERQRDTNDQDLRTALVAVESAGLCANSLRALDEGRLEVQRHILESQMEAAVGRADQKLTGVRDPKIGMAIPNLIEGVRRARQYAEIKGHLDLVAKCDRVLAALQRGTRA